MSPFLPNKLFQSEIEKQAEYQRGLRALAGEIKRSADAIARSAGAPWMPRSGQETIQVGEDADGVYVANTDYAAFIQEIGGKNNPPHAPLRQGARSAGLRVDEHR